MTYDELLMYAATGSVLLPVVAGFSRYRTMPRQYRLFLLFCLAGFVNDSTVYLIKLIYGEYEYANVNNNVYSLVCYLLLVNMYKSWGAWQKRLTSFYLLLAIGIIWWVVEVVMMQRGTLATPAVVMFYYLVYIYLSVDAINGVLVEEKRNLFKNLKFIISTGLLSAFSIFSMLEVYYLLELNFSNDMWWFLLRIILVLNTLLNITFGIALLCIPMRQKFTLPY